MATMELTTTEQQYLEVLEARIKNGLKTFWMVGEALTEIRDKKLYRKEYKTFKEYCDKRWGFTDSRARRLIMSAEIMRDVKEALPAGDAVEQKASTGTPIEAQVCPMGTLVKTGAMRTNGSHLPDAKSVTNGLVPLPI